MAEKKSEQGVRPPERAGEDVLELERRALDGSGRDPTARRGELEEGGSISDADVGEDEIKKKGVGGYGAQGDAPARGAPSAVPLTDKAAQGGGPKKEE